ncbi:Epithelial discoidin domain-containing receptor 1 [Aix galericulata]|nr:Epithelial discoidin domain-containing receptor 1 [Aix galericulata]
MPPSCVPKRSPSPMSPRRPQDVPMSPGCHHVPHMSPRCPHVLKMSPGGPRVPKVPPSLVSPCPQDVPMSPKCPQDIPVSPSPPHPRCPDVPKRSPCPQRVPIANVPKMSPCPQSVLHMSPRCPHVPRVSPFPQMSPRGPRVPKVPPSLVSPCPQDVPTSPRCPHVPQMPPRHPRVPKVPPSPPHPRCPYVPKTSPRGVPIPAVPTMSPPCPHRVPRLGRSDGDGAWCPAGPVFPAEEEFLEVDLGHLHLVTLVGTQGRHAGGQGREFARAYRLRYSRDRRRWTRWRDRWGTEEIGGNEDPAGVVLKDLAPPPVARALRVYPPAPRAMSVCLRLELYGCPWDGGLLSYTAPRGHVMALSPAPVVLNDSTYDGDSAGPLLFGGLGQLADGVLGLDDFARSRERRLGPGYDYVGWRRPPGPRPRLQLDFEFERPRTFHAMQVPRGMLGGRD